jgi:hypothetical protein
MSTSLSRSHFKKGFDDTLLLKNLRKAVGLAGRSEQNVGLDDTHPKRSVVMTRTSRKGWDVKRAS